MLKSSFIYDFTYVSDVWMELLGLENDWAARKSIIMKKLNTLYGKSRNDSLIIL